MSEFQRNIIVENTTCGLMVARKAGKRLGRPPKLSPDSVAEAHRQIAQRQRDLTEIAALLNVHPRTVVRAFAGIADEAA